MERYPGMNKADRRDNYESRPGWDNPDSTLERIPYTKGKQPLSRSERADFVDKCKDELPIEWIESKLDECLFDIYLMRHVHNMTLRDIGRELGVSDTTVGKRLYADTRSVYSLLVYHARREYKEFIREVGI